MIDKETLEQLYSASVKTEENTFRKFIVSLDGSIVKNFNEDFLNGTIPEAIDSILEGKTKNETVSEQELLENMNIASQGILLIDLLLKISDFLTNLVVENASNLIDIEDAIVKALLDMTNIIIPCLVFTLYAIYSPFVDFKFFENIPQKGGLLFPIIDPFLVYNYLIKQDYREWKHFHDLDDHFLSFNLILDYETNPDNILNFLNLKIEKLNNVKLNVIEYDKYTSDINNSELIKRNIYGNFYKQTELQFLNVKGKLLNNFY